MAEYNYAKDWEDGDIYRVKKGEDGRGNFDTFIPWRGENGEWVHCKETCTLDPLNMFDKGSDITEEEAMSRIEDQIAYAKKHDPEKKGFSLKKVEYRADTDDIKAFLGEK